MSAEFVSEDKMLDLHSLGRSIGRSGAVLVCRAVSGGPVGDWCC